jgi:hypothetical protein
MSTPETNNPGPPRILTRPITTPDIGALAARIAQLNAGVSAAAQQATQTPPKE